MSETWHEIASVERSSIHERTWGTASSDTIVAGPLRLVKAYVAFCFEGRIDRTRWKRASDDLWVYEGKW